MAVATEFTITLDGVELGTFSELTGIASESESSEYWEQGDDGLPIIGRSLGFEKPQTISLQQAINGKMQLWDWHDELRLGRRDEAQKDCILVCSTDGSIVARFLLVAAWPSKVELAGLRAGSSDLVIETLTLTYEQIERLSL